MPTLEMDALIAWSRTEDAARALWHAWFTAMQEQHRDVDRHRSKWAILDPQDQALDSLIVQKVVAEMLATVASEQEVARGRG